MSIIMLEAEKLSRVPRHRINDWANKGLLGRVEEVKRGRTKYRLFTIKQVELIRLIDKYRDDNTLKVSFELAKSEMRGEV